MPRTPHALPAGLPSPAFTVATARAHAVSESRLRRADLRTPFHGVRVSRGLDDRHDGADDVAVLCRAALTVLPAGALLTHVTALRLLGLAPPWQLDRDTRVHVLLGRDTAPPRRRGLVAHTTKDLPAGHRSATGLLVVPPARLWRDLAADLDVDALVVVADALLRRVRPLTTQDALNDEVGRAPAGHRGVRRLRAALPDLRPGTDSPMETRTRLLLVRSGLPCPEVNVRLHEPSGRFLAMPDLLYRRQRIAIEYDGDIHRTNQRAWRRDIERRERLQAEGWLVLTVTADDVLHRPHALATRVAKALHARTPAHL